MTRPPIGSPNWGVLLNADLDGIEATAEAALDAAASYDTGYRRIVAGGLTIDVCRVSRTSEHDEVTYRVNGIDFGTDVFANVIPEGWRPDLAFTQPYYETEDAGIRAIGFETNGTVYVSLGAEFGGVGGLNVSILVPVAGRPAQPYPGVPGPF